MERARDDDRDRPWLWLLCREREWDRLRLVERSRCCLDDGFGGGGVGEMDDGDSLLPDLFDRSIASLFSGSLSASVVGGGSSS